MEINDELKDVDIPDNFIVEYIELSDRTQLRHLYYHPENSRGRILLYPGMNTLVLSWVKVLNLLSELNYSIDYIESREKMSAIYTDNSTISKERMIQDCVEVCNLLGLEGNNYLVLASSLGATTVIYAMAQNEIFPSNVVLVGPTTEFRVPLTIRLLLPVTNYWTYRNIGKKILKQIVMRKFTDEKADPFQKKKYSLALDLADPVRLKKCIRAWYKTTIYNEFPLIDGKRSFCYLIGASEDKLHPDRDSKLASESIENAKFIDLKTNSAAHDKPLIDLIDKTIMN